MVCGVDLGDVLDSSKESGHNTQAGSPGPEMLRRHCREDPCYHNDHQAMKQCYCRDHQGGLPPRLVLLEVFFVIGVFGGVVSEENEEQDEAGSANVNCYPVLTTGTWR